MPLNIPHTVVRHWEVGHEHEPDGDRPGHFMVHPHLTVVHPPLTGGRGIFHAKTWFIVFEKHLRIVVCSANLERIEWEHTHQIVWYQDFPRVEKDQTSPSCEFKEQLDFLLSHWGLESAFLNQYDLTSTLVGWPS